MTNRYLTRKQLPAIVGISAVTIWRLERDGKFPKRRQLSAGRVGWLASEVEEWMQGREVAVTTTAA